MTRVDDRARVPVLILIEILTIILNLLQNAVEMGWSVLFTLAASVAAYWTFPPPERARARSRGRSGGRGAASAADFDPSGRPPIAWLHDKRLRFALALSLAVLAAASWGAQASLAVALTVGLAVATLASSVLVMLGGDGILGTGAPHPQGVGAGPVSGPRSSTRRGTLRHAWGRAAGWSRGIAAVLGGFAWFVAASLWTPLVLPRLGVHLGSAVAVSTVAAPLVWVAAAVVAGFARTAGQAWVAIVGVTAFLAVTSWGAASLS